jgi:error-prone DNA polymerase
MPVGEHVVNDYRYLSLSLKAHPVSFIRPRLVARGVIASEALRATKSGRRVTVAGLAIVRQRPGTASGVIFMTIEDETDIANIVVWPKLFEPGRWCSVPASSPSPAGCRTRAASSMSCRAARGPNPVLGVFRPSPCKADAGRAIDPRARADEVRRPGQDHERATAPASAAIPDVRFSGAPRALPAKATSAVMPKGRNFH